MAWVVIVYVQNSFNMGKRKCSFSSNLKEEFPFLKEDSETNKVECTLSVPLYQLNMEVILISPSIERKKT
jgi:hypothetical protein